MSSPPVPPLRVRSIDVARGLVMVLMAIDHVRVYSGVPAGGPSPGVFFTRWITHFCAPAFVFLAGTSAFLSGERIGRPALARYLVTRGLLLVFLELTLLRFAWTFNLDYAHYVLAGVIWVIGWCMVLMGGLVFLPPSVVGWLGVAVIALHNLIGVRESPGSLLKVVYFGGGVPIGGSTLVILYSIVPWIGVMAAGYGFGLVLKGPAPDSDRRLLTIGLGATALFVLLRATGVYGDPRPWAAQTARMPSPLAFLNTTKYPASLQFLLMTLGPTIAALPLLERARGRIGAALETFGRVPFFFYVLHIPLIHLMAIGVSAMRSGSIDPWFFANHPAWVPPAPEGAVWPLWLLYLVWAVATAILYLACRRYARVKAQRPGGLLRYL